MESRNSPLYSTEITPHAKKRRAYACIYFAAIVGLIYYRIVCMPSECYLPWILVFAAELGFAFVWTLDQAFRWRPVHRYTFPEMLSNRFERELPPVDIFICTADPVKEHPLNVVNTVLSTLAFDYPVEKLSCYVSDDGGSPLTFYALFEASCFAKVWVPFCHKYRILQRCPHAYFSEDHAQDKGSLSVTRTEWKTVKEMYEEMKYCITMTIERGSVPEDKCDKHGGFRQWRAGISSQYHPSIVEVLLDKGKDTGVGGCALPSLVYVSREKQAGHPHNFKAGAINALIRVSMVMSNAPFILTVDCDMYANNCEALREAMCFFMDPETGHRFAYVQFPQTFHGITKNDLYANNLRRIFNVHFKGFDGIEGPMYVGTGCVHRRDALCGSEPKHSSSNLDNQSIYSTPSSGKKSSLLDEARAVTECSYEENTLWGKKVGMLYGSAVEDVLTGFVIQCRGWKSAFCAPRRTAFLGCVPVNLNDKLIVLKRLAAGLLEFFVSRFCPFSYGLSRAKIAQRMAYGFYCLWAPSSLHILCYGLVPSLCMLRGVSLFPKSLANYLVYRRWVLK